MALWIVIIPGVVLVPGLGSSPVDGSWPEGLDANDALALQKAAESVLP
jgi:hypothetical protein